MPIQVKYEIRRLLHLTESPLEDILPNLPVESLLKQAIALISLCRSIGVKQGTNAKNKFREKAVTDENGNNSQKRKPAVEQAGEDLFNFAIDRRNLKALMANLPESAGIKHATVEYELQILKIISVGWGLSYYLGNNPQKDAIATIYWSAVNEFSKNLSETTERMTGHIIDYFQTLKDRLDMYLDALQRKPDAPEAVAVIGPEFARFCGNADDVFTVMTGSRMFTLTLGSVKEYLDAVNLGKHENSRPGG